MCNSLTDVKCNMFLLGITTNPTGRGRTARQADTNVIAVKFNTLTEPSHMHTGDAVVCSNKDCTAILSHLSKLKQNTETGAKVSLRLLWVVHYKYFCFPSLLFAK